MDDAARVGVREAAGHLHGDAQGLCEGHGTGLESLGQGLAAEEFEDQVGAELTSPHVVEGDDVRVGEARRRLGLVQEPFLPRGGPDGGLQQLEGHRPSQLEIEGLVDDAEPATTQFPDDLEPADHRSRSGGRVPCGCVRGGRDLGADEVLEERGDAGRAWSGPNLGVRVPVVHRRHPKCPPRASPEHYQRRPLAANPPGSERKDGVAGRPGRPVSPGFQPHGRIPDLDRRQECRRGCPIHLPTMSHRRWA